MNWLLLRSVNNRSGLQPSRLYRLFLFITGMFSFHEQGELKEKANFQLINCTAFKKVMHRALTKLHNILCLMSKS